MVLLCREAVDVIKRGPALQLNHLSSWLESGTDQGNSLIPHCGFRGDQGLIETKMQLSGGHTAPPTQNHRVGVGDWDFFLKKLYNRKVGGMVRGGVTVPPMAAWRCPN